MKGKISISRPSCGTGREYISIRVQDSLSRTRFLDVEINLDDFTKLITGLGDTDCSIECRDLDRVGKELIQEGVEVEMPRDGCPSYSKTIANQRTLKHIEKSGLDWVIFGGFNSQNSFFKRDGKSYARTNLRRWV